MFTLIIPAVQGWDEEKEEFVESKKEVKLQLEHSLISLSKWESKYCKAFLTKDDKTTEETIDYIRCMTITQNVDDSVYDNLTNKQINEIISYINAPMTASSVNDNDGNKNTINREKVTSELIYYWMIALNIPFECQRWHLNRLLMLIRICNKKNSPGKKMSKRDIMRRNAEMNNARRKAMNTSG